MELVVLDIKTLEVKEHGFITNDYEIIVNSVVYQKSKFRMNKENVNADVGDIVFVKGLPFSYLGIIEAISNEDDFTTLFEINEFSSIFDVSVVVSSYSGDLCVFLKNLIEGVFNKNDDIYQNLDYLNITTSASIQGSLSYDGNELITISELLEVLNKSYGIRLDYKLEVSTKGKISKILVDITNITKGMKLRYNLPSITNLSITDSKEQGTNNVIYYPSSDNTTYKTTICYYLLNDGTITTDSTNSKRYKHVKSISSFYSDSEYDSLYTKASSELLSSNLEHNIEFQLSMDNKVVVPFKNLSLGDFVEFIGKNKTYSTMVTQLSFKGNIKSCTVTLGEYRIKLTDKIKLLEKK